MQYRFRRRRRLSAALSATAAGVVTAAALTVPAAPAWAEPLPNPTPAERDFGNGPERNEHAVPEEIAEAQTLHDPQSRHPWHRSGGYPRQTDLPEHPENPEDAAIKLGLVPYHDIAPQLNELQGTSDRVSAEIVGESHEGRDIYLVTVTEPETRAETRRQDRLRDKILERPAAAARDKKLPKDYKAPVFINNNIHGNEWEGTDASLGIIEELATSADPEVEELLDSSRIYFNITANPDGRVAGQRANAAGFDLNRDFVTSSQPEGVAMRDIMVETQSLVVLDQHGYVNGTLIEPATRPHGQNYEYDLYIKHTYANAINMEEAVNGLGYTPEDDGVLPVQIPFRDWEEGWDDWPPIFTPMYAPYQGTVAAATIEFPMRVNGADYEELPEEELQRRSAINTEISAATIETTFAYVMDSREELISDQIEVFRRGEAGEEQVTPPDEWVPGFGSEDVWHTEFPRAYVIPSGGDQRSETAAARLVDHLIAHDVRVRQATRSFKLGGTTYPAGSYLVDMHQPKRGMANVLLEAGRDISPDIDQMYDISGWSHGLLWGASVDAITGNLRGVRSRPVLAAAPTGSVADDGDLELRLDDGKEVAALNELLSSDAEVAWTGEGSVVIGADAREDAVELADRYGVQFHSAAAEGTAPLESLTVAAAAAPDELFTLRELGYDPVAVSTGVLNDGFDWSGTDVLYVSSGLDYTALDAGARDALDDFLTRGGVVTRGAAGAAFNEAAGLLAVEAQAGNPSANGVVQVGEADGSGVVSGFGEHAFVYSPLWFTDLGPGVAVEQAYGTEGPLVAGHWLPDADGEGGPDAALGQAAIVSGVAEQGAGVVLFGTEPMFRNHPKGMFAQVARAMHWSVVAAEVPEAVG